MAVKKIILAVALLGMSGVAQAISMDLVAHNQRTSGGTLVYLNWKDCGAGPYPIFSGCVSPNNSWVIANGVVGATPTSLTWEWDGTTLTSTGTFTTYSSIGSGPAGTVVIGDKIVNMVINTATQTTTADTYNCLEGTFLASVGVNGCLNTSTGPNFANDSSALYNVGGDANCVQRTVGGDDTSTGNPRGLHSALQTGTCDPVDGAFNLWTAEDNTATGGTLILRTTIPTTDPGANWLTFEAPPVPVPAAGWLIAPALGLLSPWVKRRQTTA